MEAPTTAAQVLDLIDEFYCNATIPYKEKSGLSDVLSALRGPDSEVSRRGKLLYTVPIRAAAFPKLAAASKFGHCIILGQVKNDDGSIPPLVRVPAPPVGEEHYYSHVRDAILFLQGMGRGVTQTEGEPQC